MHALAADQIAGDRIAVRRATADSRRLRRRTVRPRRRTGWFLTLLARP